MLPLEPSFPKLCSKNEKTWNSQLKKGKKRWNSQLVPNHGVSILWKRVMEDFWMGALSIISNA
jgi:hypothetical protein